MQTIENTTIYRKEHIKVLVKDIKATKNEIKELMRAYSGRTYIAQYKLFELKEEVRYLNIIHSLLKRKIDLNQDFDLILEHIVSNGIETKWKPIQGCGTVNSPNEDVFRRLVEKYITN